MGLLGSLQSSLQIVGLGAEFDRNAGRITCETQFSGVPSAGSSWHQTDQLDVEAKNMIWLDMVICFIII